MKQLSDKYNNLLVEKFNKRNNHAFSQVYIELFDELNYFSKCLFVNTEIDSEDVVQDIFINIWDGKHKFENIVHIKNYIYQSIKNKHKDFLKHQTVHNNFSSDISKLEEYQFCQMVETEVYSILNIAQKVLKPINVEILRLYIEGYDINSISEKLGKSQFTIHHKKKESIDILKKHVSKNTFTFLLNFFNI